MNLSCPTHGVLPYYRDADARPAVAADPPGERERDLRAEYDAWWIAAIGDEPAHVRRRIVSRVEVFARRAAAFPAAAPAGGPSESVESLAHTLVTLPDVLLQNDPLLIAGDLLDRLPLARRAATLEEISSYAALRAGAAAPNDAK